MYCPSCGVQNNNNGAFCKQCGAALPKLPSTSTDKKKKIRTRVDCVRTAICDDARFLSISAIMLSFVGCIIQLDGSLMGSLGYVPSMIIQIALWAALWWGLRRLGSQSAYWAFCEVVLGLVGIVLWVVTVSLAAPSAMAMTLGVDEIDSALKEWRDAVTVAEMLIGIGLFTSTLWHHTGRIRVLALVSLVETLGSGLFERALSNEDSSMVVTTIFNAVVVWLLGRILTTQGGDSGKTV